VTDVDLSSKRKSAPRHLVHRNEDRKINNAYIVGDGISIEVGKDIKLEAQMSLYRSPDITKSS